MKSVWIFFIGIVLFSTASTAQEPDSLGSFEPKTDVAFVAAENPTWNGKPVPIVKDDKDGLLIGFFNFTRVKIPYGVRVQFEGFDIVFITSEEEVEINGVMTQMGENGAPGSNAQDVQGGDGGDGGSGLGRGFGGQGGGGLSRGYGDGTDNAGTGGLGTRHPTFAEKGIVVCDDTSGLGGGGAASGSNGSRGAGAFGFWRGPDRTTTGYYQAQPPYVRDFNPEQVDIPGGGSGGGGGCARLGGCGGQCAGGGGGGGGSTGGAFMLVSQRDIQINGEINVNGGSGGRGGSAAGIGAQQGGGGGGGAGAAGGYIYLEGTNVSIVDQPVTGYLKALGGSFGEGSPGNPNGWRGTPGGGGRIKLVATASDGRVTDASGNVVSRDGKPACWDSQTGIQDCPQSNYAPGEPSIQVVLGTVKE